MTRPQPEKAPDRECRQAVESFIDEIEERPCARPIAAIPAATGMSGAPCESKRYIARDAAPVKTAHLRFISSTP